jgi:hypothetical protein
MDFVAGLRRKGTKKPIKNRNFRKNLLYTRVAGIGDNCDVRVNRVFDVNIGQDENRKPRWDSHPSNRFGEMTPCVRLGRN